MEILGTLLILFYVLLMINIDFLNLNKCAWYACVLPQLLMYVDILPIFSVSIHKFTDCNHQQGSVTPQYLSGMFSCTSVQSTYHRSWSCSQCSL